MLTAGLRVRIAAAVTAAGVLPLASCGFGASTPATVTVTQPAAVATTAPGTPAPAVGTGVGTSGEWAAVVRRVQDSVVRLDVLTCDSRSMGSGFMVGEDQLLTAAHVVEGAATVQVQLGGKVVPARVVAVDAANDSALLRLLRPLPGTARLDLTDQGVDKGAAVGMLGYPLRTYELRITQGIISGLDERVDYGEVSAEHAYITDAAINGGNSGGLVVDRSGRVIGLVSGSRVSVNGSDAAADRVDGVGYIVPSRFLVANLSRWQGVAPLTPARCQGDSRPPAGEGQLLTVEVNAGDPAAAEIARTLEAHGRSINEGRYDAAWQVFTPAMQRTMRGMHTWKRGLATSFWVAGTVLDVTGGEHAKLVRVQLRTNQDAKDGYRGQTCSLFVNDYTMVNAHGGWQIERVSEPEGKQRPCPD